MTDFAELTRKVFAAPRETANSITKMDSVLLNIMELTVFKLTCDQDGLRIAKPYLNDENLAIERSYVCTGKLSIEAKRFL